MIAEDVFNVRRFSDDFADLLRDLIADGELQPGERLNEVKLSKKYGISRSPIREALQALSGEGLVEFVAGKGAYVTEISKERIQEFNEIRESLELLALKRIHATASPEKLAQFLKLVQSQKSGFVEGAYPPRNFDFHHELFVLAGNQELLRLSVSVSSYINLARRRSARKAGRVEEAHVEHVAIVEALVNNDLDKAKALLKKHLHTSSTNTLLFFQ